MPREWRMVERRAHDGAGRRLDAAGSGAPGARPPYDRDRGGTGDGTGDEGMAETTDVWQGTLALMVLKTLQTIGPLHGYGIARRIEQVSGSLVSVKYGTLYPALLKLE